MVMTALVLLGISAPAAAETSRPPPLPKLMVTGLEAERGFDPGLLRLLNDLLLTEFGRAETYDVTGGSDIDVILSASEQRRLAGCGDESCIAEIGGALGADFFSSGSIGKVGSFYLINLKIINVKEVKTLRRWSGQVDDDEDELFEVIREAVAEVSAPVDPLPEEAIAAAAGEPDTGLSLRAVWNRQVMAWVAVSLAALSTAAAVFFFVKAEEFHGKFEKKCPDGGCPPSLYLRGSQLGVIGEEHQLGGNVSLVTSVVFGLLGGSLFVFDELDWFFE